MFKAVILQFLLLVSIRLSASADNTSSLQIPKTANLITGPCQAIEVESEAIREEAGRIRQEGYAAMDKAYQIKDEAYETLNSAFESRRELESLLVDMVTLMKTQTSTTSLYIQDMRNVLTGLADKVERLEESIGGVQQTVEEETAALKRQSGDMADKLQEDRALLEQEIGKVKMSLDEVGSELNSKIDVTTSLSSSIKSRQQVWMSEIRLISLYKSVDQNHPHPDYGTME